MRGSASIATQLDQMLINLVGNALDATRQGGRCGSAPASVDGADGRYAVLRVSDRRTGIDDATRPHIFEPYFTTKRAGRAGLGLAIVHALVERPAVHPGRERAGQGHDGGDPPAGGGLIEPHGDGTRIPRTEDRTMPLTQDENLLALSRRVIEAFDAASGGMHPGFRPAHAKGILLSERSSRLRTLRRSPGRRILAGPR